jgi:HPt (histidine-containing phosphotransfer) domain-containing protein
MSYAMPYPLDPDCELPEHLIELFLKASPVQLALVVEQCGRRDVGGARLAAHKLKGALYAAGASALAEQVEELRNSLSKENWPVVDRQLQAVRDDFARLLVALERRLRAESRA